MLPSGKRLVSEANLLARYEPNVVVGADATYGMALMVDKRRAACGSSITAATSPATTAT